MITEFDIEFIKREMENKKKTFLHAVGMSAVNTSASLAPWDTGALRNSITYKMSDGTGSKFQSQFGRKGGGNPPSDAEIGASNDPDYVKVGSALSYAAVQEAKGRSAGFMARTVDQLQKSGLIKIAEQVFKW